jgi:serine/threonine-protein kinase RsbT
MSAHPALSAVPPLSVAKICVPLETDAHVASARQKGRLLATRLGFSSSDATIIATAISELARNILLYAREGRIQIQPVERGPRRGLIVVASDHGPGIADVQRALQDGFSTSGRLGLGLPGVKRLMDEFEIESCATNGTTVTVKKWNA